MLKKNNINWISSWCTPLPPLGAVHKLCQWPKGVGGENADIGWQSGEWGLKNADSGWQRGEGSLINDENKMKMMKALTKMPLKVQKPTWTGILA